MRVLVFRVYTEALFAETAMSLAAPGLDILDSPCFLGD